MQSVYNIADIKIGVNTPFEYKECNEFLPYLCTAQNCNTYFNFTVEEFYPFNALPVFENGFLKIYNINGTVYRDFNIPYDTEPCARITKTENGFNCLCSPEKLFYFAETWNIFNAVGLEWTLFEFGRCILHSSHIKTENGAVLFTAPSGTGKSTAAALWEKYRGAEVINGDRTALGITGNGAVAYGLPIAGSSNIFKNVTSPLRAIVVLRQAPVNKCERLGGAAAFKWLLSETTVSSWIDGFYQSVCDILLQIINTVPIYMLHCTPDESAVECLEKALNNN